jgi:hypothetical protein
MRRSDFLAGVVASAAASSQSRRPVWLHAFPLAHDIHPYRDAEIGVDEISWLYADGLVGWNNGVVPLLAAQLPDVRDGGRRLRYVLRRAIWHDGRPFVAQDVAVALAALRETRWGSYEPYRWIRGDIIIRNDYEFDVLLDSPRPRFVRSFFGPYGTPALPLIRLAPDGRTPIGTGPFAVRAHPEPERWRLERFDRSPRGKPRLDAIELRLVPGDAKAISNEPDILLPIPADAVGAGRFRRVHRLTSTAVLVFNTTGIFGDSAIRRAFAGGANMPLLQRAYDPAKENLVASLLMTGDDDPALKRMLAFDSGAATSLQSRLQGREPVFSFIRGNKHHEQTQLILRQNLPGVAWQMNGTTTLAYMSEQGPLRTGRFDLAISGLIYDDQPDLAADWSCAGGKPVPGNFARWCDAGFESAVARNDMAAALRRLYDELPCIPLTRAREDIGVSRIEGLDAPAPLTPATYGCNRWVAQ